MQCFSTIFLRVDNFIIKFLTCFLAVLLHGILNCALIAVSDSQDSEPLNIEITAGRLVTPRTAVVDFKTNNDKEAVAFAKTIVEIIKNNLNNCKFFQVVPKVAFIQDLRQYSKVTQFTDWQAIDVKILVDGHVEIDSKTKKLKVKFAVYDVGLQKMIVSKMFVAKVDLLRRIAHKISDVIYETFTGDQGIFDRKIACVEHYLDKNNVKQQRLITIDQDLFDDSKKIISKSGNLVSNPVFFKDNKKIVFLEWQQDKNLFNSANYKPKLKGMRVTGNFNMPELKIVNLKNGKTVTIKDKNLFQENDMAFAPSFSKDGKLILLSISKGANSFIFEYDMAKKKFRQITAGCYLDTSAVFSHDETRIYFVSDRSGYPNIYSIKRNGRGLRRITFGPGSYYCPVCAPDGKHLAFIKIMNKSFYIGCLDIDGDFEGDEERLIAKSYNFDTLRWVSNNIMSFSYISSRRKHGMKENVSKIGTIDVSGNKWRTVEIKDATSLTSPMWSY